MVASTTDTMGSEQGKRLALIIGVDEAPRSSLAPLHHATADAESMATVLEQYGKFTVLAPQLRGKEATSNAIKKAVLNLMRDRIENDVLLLYFSGHGLYLPVEREDQPGVDLVYLVTSDFCEQEAEEDPTLHLSMRWLRDNLVIKTRAGQVLLILDCCYAGAIGQTGPDPLYQDLLQQIASYFGNTSTVRAAKPGGLRLALTSTNALLPSREGNEHGVMTEPLLRALRGEVLDVFGNEGQITVTSLYGYLHETMPTGQKPSFSGDAAAKNYILAWHPERLAELRTKLGHSIVNARPNSYIPFPHSLLFQPRPGEFEQLEQLLFDQGTEHKPIRLGLVGVLGLGGIGKTQLTIELAHRYKDRFPAGIFWMPATGTTALDWQRSLAELADKTEYLPANDDPSDQENEARRARHLCRYLASHRDVLLILDNVEDPSLVTSTLPALAGEEVVCTLLYTSRNTVTPPGVIPHIVEQLPEDGALHLLLETTRPSLLTDVITGSQSAQAEAAREICRTVGYLPLALIQLRGLLARDKQMSLERLNEVLKQRGILDLEKKTQLGDVALLFRTFWLSWAKVEDREARRLFKFAAYFPEAVPIPLWLLGLTAGLGEDWHYPNAFWEALVSLQELSLIERLSGDQVRLHPLVHAFGRQLVTEEPDKGKALRKEAVKRLMAEFTHLHQLEQRARRNGFWQCVEQVRAARQYLVRIAPAQAERVARWERLLDRESHLLSDRDLWPERLPGLFFQQVMNRAVEEQSPLPMEQSPHPWVRQVAPVGIGKRQRRQGDGGDRGLLRILTHQSTVKSVAFSPDGKRLLTGSDTAQLWDADSRQVLLTLTGHQSTVKSVAFSPDGRQVLTGSSDQTARLWDAANGQVLLTLTVHGHQGTVNSVAFSPDGKRVLTGSSDQTARLWDAASGQELLTMKDEWGFVRSVAFSPDGTRLLTGSGDMVRLWDAASGLPLLTLPGHQSSVESVAFSPDGRRLLTGSWDKTARLWDAASGQVLLTLTGHQEIVTSVAFSPDGRRLLTGSDDKTARLWDAASGESPHTGIQHFPLPKATLSIWYTLADHWDKVDSVAFSPDGTRLLTGSRNRVVRLWDVASGRELHTLTDDQSWNFRGAYGSDDTRMIAGHQGTVNSVAFSPDGKRLLTGSDDKTAWLWDAASGQVLLILKGHQDSVTSVAFSPDGRQVLTGSDDMVRLWDATNGLPLLTLNGKWGWVRSVAFSPDGTRLLTCSGNMVRLWDAASGLPLLTLPGHQSSVESVAFSPDGRLLVTGGRNGWAFFWANVEANHEQLIGGYFADYSIRAIYWQDYQHLLLADEGGPGNVPYLYRLKLEGM